MNAQTIYRNVVEEIGVVSPPGLATWSLTYEITRGSWDDFMDAVAAWEVEDTEATRRVVNLRGTELVQTYQEAGRLFRIVEGAGEREEVPHGV